ncbi:hypothetical protein HY745_04845 [Candidatus Desantisbacteria bacterium]|nr:hypothetical protein [Candidatus Desantisbacteria bacterium]
MDKVPAGEFRWLDEKTLQFKPADAWPPLTQFKWTIDNTTKEFITLLSIPEEVRIKDSSKNIDKIIAQTDKPKNAYSRKRNYYENYNEEENEYNNEEFLEYSNERTKNYNNGENLSEVSEIIFIFKDRIEINKLKNLISIELRSLPGINKEESVLLNQDDYTLKPVERNVFKDKFTYILAFKIPVKEGFKVILNLFLSSDEKLKDSKIEYLFATKEPFRVKAIGIGNTSYNITLFKPAIEKIEFTLADRKLLIKGNIKEETLYKAEISPVKLSDGRQLQNKASSEFYFYFPKKEAFLVWKECNVIIERYGPQQIPMTGRADTKIDLRIYKIDPLNLALWPFPDSPIIIDESTRPPIPGEEPISTESIKNFISSNDFNTHLKMLGSPLISNVIDLPKISSINKTDFGLDVKKFLGDISGSGKSGTYLIGYRRLNDENKRYYVRVQVTDLCLTTFEEKRGIKFVVTSLKTGKPIEDAKIILQGNTGYRTSEFSDIIIGETDESGMFYYLHKNNLQSNFTRFIVKKDDDILVINPANPPVSFLNNHWFKTQNSWLSWLNSYPKYFGTEPDNTDSLVKGFVFSERPIYRPEEEVYIKGYVRKILEGKYSIEQNISIELEIVGPDENKTWKYPLKLTSQGSFYYKFQEQSLPSGNYTVNIYRILNPGRYFIAKTDFKKEAYRIPKFKIELYGQDKVPLDREFTVLLTGDYYAGGKVIGRPVTWRVTKFSYAHTPKEKEGYIFSTDNRYSKSQEKTSSGVIEKKDITDESGSARLIINPALETEGKPILYIVEATVTDIDEQTFTITQKVIALPAFNIGVKLERYYKDFKNIIPEIIALDVFDKLQDGVELNVNLLKREWHSRLQETDFSSGELSYINDIVDNKMYETTVITGEELNKLQLPVKEAGVYVLEVEARDKLNRLQLVSVDFYVSGNEKVSWEKTKESIFEVVANKDNYDSDEKASIVLKSPFQNAEAIAIVEAPDKNYYFWMNVKNGSAVFEFPILKTYIPKIPVHFLLLRGRNTDEIKNSNDIGRPKSIASTIYIKVNPEQNRAIIDLSHPKKAIPGEEIKILISLTNLKKEPIPGEVTLWFVDEAVLALRKEKSIDPLPNFIPDVESYLRIIDTRNKVIGNVLTSEYPGGDTGGDESGTFFKGNVRKNFKTVPYYNPNILVDESGKIEVTIKLPDNLTNFAIRAVICSKEDKFGFAKSLISVRLPVIIQPAMPRFVRIGDKFTAGGIGRIVEGEGGAGLCSIETEGLTIENNKVKKIDWLLNKPKQIYYNFNVNTHIFNDKGLLIDNKVKIKMSVIRNSDNKGDAFEITLPLKDDRKQIIQQKFVNLEKNKKISFSEIKEKYRKNSLRRTALISNQIRILKMASSIQYLINFPYGCTEQKISRVYPALALKGIFSNFKIDELIPNIDIIVKETLEYLKQTMTRDGLYSYWPGGRGYVNLTAYVLEFLVEAKKAGYSVDDDLYARAIDSLKKAMRSDYNLFIDGYAYEERSYALYALSMAGQFDPAYANEMYKSAKVLPLHTESKILLAFLNSNYKNEKILSDMSDDLWNNLIFKLRDGKEVYGGLQDRVDSWGGLINSNEITTLANVISALSHAKTKDPKFNLLVDELITTCGKDGWGNTNATSASLLALKDVTGTDKTTIGEYALQINFGGKNNKLKVNNQNPTVFLVSNDEGDANITMNESSLNNPLYARLEVSYIPDKQGDTVKAENKGFVVTREIIHILKDGQAPKRYLIEKENEKYNFNIGDVIEEHIQVINPEDRYFVAIIAPMASGFEPLNPNLDISPPESKPQGENTLNSTYNMFQDDYVGYFYDFLPKGTYDFYYRLKAYTEGSFIHPAAYAEMMYMQSVSGNSNGTRIVIEK